MKSLSAAALALFAAVPSFAASTVIDFEGVTSFSSVAQYYNGGADSAGKTGPSLGVTFGGDALGISNDALGPYFSHAPSPLGVMAPVGTDATMNVAGGFVDSISFYYSSSSFVGSGVNVWSGLGGTGTLLASFNLVGNAQSNCADSAFCRFDMVSSTFAGTAHSVVFGASANSAGFDNISFTAAVPEPASMLLMAVGVAGLMVSRRRV